MTRHVPIKKKPPGDKSFKTKVREHWRYYNQDIFLYFLFIWFITYSLLLRGSKQRCTTVQKGGQDD